MKEYIICSAIWFDDGKAYVHQPTNIETGFVMCGMRHHNVFTTISILQEIIDGHSTLDLFEKKQGFLTNKNRFVDRTEAKEIALKADQIIDLKKLKSMLFSEDIY